MTVEKVKLKGIIKSRENVHHVPRAQWVKWGPVARQVFNEVFSIMSRNQWSFLHPQQEKLSNRLWKTTAWNAAWVAAEAAAG